MTELASALSPLVITDVDYLEPGARAAAIVAAAWTAPSSVEERVVRIDAVAEYRPGAFFERELPCLLAVLGAVAATFRCILIDGFVELDAEGTAGLGAHLFEALHRAVPVIGVAKTPFRGAAFATPVLRGESRAPLFVTARGASAEDAARLVGAMHGRHRIPTLLKRVDHLARGRALVARTP